MGVSKPKNPKLAPVGSSVVKYKATWSRGTNYSSQKFWYKVDRVGKSDGWKEVSVKDSATAATFTIGKESDFYPSNNKPKVTAISVKIKGKKGKNWSDETIKKFDVDTPKTICTSNANLWNENEATSTKFDCAMKDPGNDIRPFKRLEYECRTFTDCTADTKEEFAKIWKNGTKDSSRSGDTTSKKKSVSKRTETNTASQKITTAYRARCVGLAGDGDWVYAWHAFGPSSKAENTGVATDSENNPKVDIDPYSQTISFDIKWDFSLDAATEPEYITIDYFIGVPRAGLNLPANPNWQVYERRDIKETGKKNKTALRKDSATVVLNQALQLDNCVWARITGYKSGHATPGDPILVAKGALTAPTIGSFTKNDTTHRITVTITNNSSVEDSDIAVIYHDGTTEYEGKILGIIPHAKSGQSYTFQGPDWTDAQYVGIEAFAFAGASISTKNYDGITVYELNKWASGYGTTTWTTVSSHLQASIVVPDHTYDELKPVYYEVYNNSGYLLTQGRDYEVNITPASSVDQLTFTCRMLDTTITPSRFLVRCNIQNDISNYMESNRVSNDAISVPKAPGDVTAVLLDDGTTIQVTWEMTWNEADGSEVSWADHADAWYSTSAPNIFDVENIDEPKLNLSNITQGTTWYIRVRLYKYTSTGSKVYGSYTEYNGGNGISTAAAPDVPTLRLSDNVIPEFGKSTASWVYVTNDTTDQKEAYLGEVVNGEIVPLPIEIKTEQHAVINPSAMQLSDWTDDTVHKICVKVISDSGKESEWSEPVELTIAPLPTCQITAFGPTYHNDLVNPTTYTGASVTVPAGTEENIKVAADIIANINYTSSKITSTSITVNSDVYEIDWSNVADNVYGGTYDLITGILTVNKNSSGSTIDPVTYELGEEHVDFVPGNNTVSASTGNVTVITCDDMDRGYILTQLPLSFTVEGAGTDGTTYISIIKLGGSVTPRPTDENHFVGDGEVICSFNYSGQDPHTITLKDLYEDQFFDDGEEYQFLAQTIVSGQIVPARRNFRVEFARKALVAGLRVDLVNNQDEWTYEDFDIAAYLTPVMPDIPSGATPSDYANDYIDIYRLSADQPQLIVSHGNFDTVYVDPYPTIGRMGGYRIVYVTSDGNFMAEYRTPSWAYNDVVEGAYLNTKFQLIDFGGTKIKFKYNIKLKNTWKKRFTKTAYLGGSTQGDWDAGYDFDGSVDGNTFFDIEPETYEQLRDLGAYDGLCHLRTIDGTNIVCNIDVSDASSFNALAHQHDISLTFTKVDNPELDGMTKEDYLYED